MIRTIYVIILSFFLTGFYATNNQEKPKNDLFSTKSLLHCAKDAYSEAQQQGDYLTAAKLNQFITTIENDLKEEKKATIRLYTCRFLHENAVYLRLCPLWAIYVYPIELEVIK